MAFHLNLGVLASSTTNSPNKCCSRNFFPTKKHSNVISWNEAKSKNQSWLCWVVSFCLFVCFGEESCKYQLKKKNRKTPCNISGNQPTVQAAGSALDRWASAPKIPGETSAGFSVEKNHRPSVSFAKDVGVKKLGGWVGYLSVKQLTEWTLAMFFFQIQWFLLNIPGCLVSLEGQMLWNQSAAFSWHCSSWNVCAPIIGSLEWCMMLVFQSYFMKANYKGYNRSYFDFDKLQPWILMIIVNHFEKNILIQIMYNIII